MELLLLVVLLWSGFAAAQVSENAPLLGSLGVFTPIAVYDSTIVNAQNQTVTAVTAESMVTVSHRLPGMSSDCSNPIGNWLADLLNWQD